MPLSVATRVERLVARTDLVGYSCDPKVQFWCRPHELLVHPDDHPAVADQLQRWRAEPLEVSPTLPYLARFGVPVLKFKLRAGLELPAAVRRLRDVAGRDDLRISPNHVFGAAPTSAFGPGGNPKATEDQHGLPDPGEADPRFVVAVLDSGIVMDAGHNPHLAAHQQLVVDAASDDDRLDFEPQDGMLDDADVHGGFIADVVRHHATRATVRVGRVLLGGTADELQVADGILRMVEQTRAQVLNLSLGGYTMDNRAPWAITDALSKLDPRPVVVAAAGNDATDRPFWPAAMDDVVGVGAVHGYDGAEGAPPVAEFSNHGPWVNACAHGVDVLSTYASFEEQSPDPTLHSMTDPAPQPQNFGGWAYWSGTSFAAPLVAARIIDRAMTIDGDPHDAAHQAAQEILQDPTAPVVQDLGILVR